MTRAIFALSMLLGLAGAAVGVQAGEKTDALTVGSVWKGEIRQGNSAFPTTIYIRGREKVRIHGEIHFRVGAEVNKLVFQGDIVDGRTVAWITDKLEGNVTFPGLYIGTLKGSSLSGTWQVPSVGQYDTFAVKLEK